MFFYDLLCYSTFFYSIFNYSFSWNQQNEELFWNKWTNEEIMKRLHRRNKFLSNKSVTDKKACNKQHHFCAILIKHAKKKLFGNINVKDMTINKTFSKTVKPLFTDKIKTTPKRKISTKCKSPIVIQEVVTFTLLTISINFLWVQILT